MKKRYQEGGPIGVSVGSNYHVPISDAQMLETRRKSDVVGKKIKGAVRKVTALTSLIPIPLIKYPSMAINGTLGVTDAYDDYQRGDKEAMMIDLATAVPIPFMSRTGLGKLTARQLSSLKKYNALSVGSSVAGTANDLTQEQYGGMSKKGYKSNSPDRNRPFNVIPSGRITMQDVPHPVMGTDNMGNTQMMMPGGEYQFPGNNVYEVPLKDINMKKKKNGGYSGTYSNGVYFANGGPVFQPGGSAPIFQAGGVTEDGEYVYPFAMYPGSGRGNGMLQDLPSHMQMGGIPGAQQVNPFAMNPGSGMGTGMLEQYANQQMRMGGKPCYDCGGKYQTGGDIKGPKGAQFVSKYSTPSFPNYTYPGDSLTNNQIPYAARYLYNSGTGGGDINLGDYENVVTEHAKYVPSEKDMKKIEAYQKKMGMWEKTKSLFGQYGSDEMPAPRQYGGAMHDYDDPTPEFKKGGNWIQGAVNPAHKGYCTPMTKSTCTPKRKAFAMTMKKHHGFHEAGGHVNPYHPLNRFMQEGGPNFSPTGRNPDDETMPVGGTSSPSAQYNSPSATGVVQDPANNAAWRQGMNDQQAEQNLNYGTGSADAYNEETGETGNEGAEEGYGNEQRQRGIGWGIAGAGLAALGAGMGIASTLSDRRDAKNLRNKQFNDRMSANTFAAQNQPGGKGDWDQYGNFRPNQNTPTKPGMFYPQTAAYGGNFAHGGMYQQGQELELSDAEIARLRKLGYKIDLL